jgi:hypothetical protein
MKSTEPRKSAARRETRTRQSLDSATSSESAQETIYIFLFHLVLSGAYSILTVSFETSSSSCDLYAQIRGTTTLTLRRCRHMSDDIFHCRLRLLARRCSENLAHDANTVMARALINVVIVLGRRVEVDITGAELRE